MESNNHTLTKMPQNTNQNTITPEYRIEETEEAFVLKAWVPGVAKDSLETIVDGDKLVISGRKTLKMPAETEAITLHQEIPRGDFHLELRLDHRVNRDNVKAELKQGILNLTLPKSESVKPRRIKIGS